MLMSVRPFTLRTCSKVYTRLCQVTAAHHLQHQQMHLTLLPRLKCHAHPVGAAQTQRCFSSSVCMFAKGKDKKKEKKWTDKLKVDEAEMAQLMDVSAFRSRLEHVVDKLRDTFVKQMSVRTSIGSLETLPVTFDGDEYPLNELAQVVRKSATLVVINSSAFPQAAADIVASLLAAGMGLNPQQEGATVYVQIPKVTREHRESLAKGAKAAFNTAKDKMRSIQNTQIREIKKDDGASEDLSHRVQSQVTTLTGQYVIAAEALLKAKTAELLGDK